MHPLYKYRREKIYSVVDEVMLEQQLYVASLVPREKRSLLAKLRVEEVIGSRP